MLFAKLYLSSTSLAVPIRKHIIPLGCFCDLNQSFYCGYAFGWIFISKIVNFRGTGGRGHCQRQRIILLNLFLGHVVRLYGQVLLLHPAPHVKNDNKVNYLRMGKDNRWKTFVFRGALLCGGRKPPL